MIHHIVLVRFADGTPADRRAAIEAAFAGLADEIDEVAALEWGTDISPEGLQKGFTHCFQLSFADTAARDAYLPHPRHRAFVALLEPCLADVLVIDYAV